MPLLEHGGGPRTVERMLTLQKEAAASLTTLCRSGEARGRVKLLRRLSLEPDTESGEAHTSFIPTSMTAFTPFTHVRHNHAHLPHMAATRAHCRPFLCFWVHRHATPVICVAGAVGAMEMMLAGFTAESDAYLRKKAAHSSWSPSFHVWRAHGHCLPSCFPFRLGGEDLRGGA